MTKDQRRETIADYTFALHDLLHHPPKALEYDLLTMKLAQATVINRHHFPGTGPAHAALLVTPNRKC